MIRPTLAGALLLAFVQANGAEITSPKKFLGFDVCEQYQLGNYKQYGAYLQLLAKESNRIRIVSMGKTEFGREQWMAIISDPANIRNLDKIKEANRQFAMASFASNEEAEQAAKKSKAVVWIDGGLHATEVLGAQQLFEQAYQLVSRNDEENTRILKDTVILLAHANPDGMDLVSDWYMRREKPETRSLNGVPILYQKYAGHDNNRDFYASNLAETRNINRVLYSEWFPQVVYNHHQSAPAGTIMYIPPFRNPFNNHMDPLIQVSTDLVGLHMHQRLIGEGKAGTIMRDGASFSTWWNGGLRTTTYFHNMVGILTETWGSPNGADIPYVRTHQLPSTDLPFPIKAGQFWKLADSLKYEISANYAILDYASRYRERLLMMMYTAGRKALEAGQTDTWTRYPSRFEQFGADAFSKPEHRDAKAYILPANPRDPGSQKWFLERLQITGIQVETLRAPLTVGEKTYPTGSVVINASQPFRAHLLDMFEAQDHPNDFQYPGGPPIAPYDSAGYTLAYQMGIEFDRILDKVTYNADPITRLDFAPGQPFADIDSYKTIANKPRVGLYDTYGGSMPSGWTRFIFERYNFPYTNVFAPDLDAGNLRAKYDVLVFVGNGIPSGPGSNRPNPLLEDTTIPDEYRRRIGSVTTGTTGPMLKQFVAEGGKIIAIGNASQAAAELFELPVETPLRGIPSKDFFIPGSVLRVALTKSELTKGLGETLDMIFDESPAFKVKGDATVVASYNSAKPLRSGWAWKQEKLEGLAAVVDCKVGNGSVLLIGPEALYRGQPSQSMKLVFNAILR